MNNLNFGQALQALKEAKCIYRESWGIKEIFVCKQVPSIININIVPKMQSLPQSAKDIFVKRAEFFEDGSIYYTDQLIIVDSDNDINSWFPNASDLFANDWLIYE